MVAFEHPYRFNSRHWAKGGCGWFCRSLQQPIPKAVAQSASFGRSNTEPCQAENMLADVRKPPLRTADTYSTALFALGFDRVRKNFCLNSPIEAMPVAPDGRVFVRGFVRDLFT